MKKSIKTLRKEVALSELNVLKIYLRELLKNRSAKTKFEINTEVDLLEKYIKEI